MKTPTRRPNSAAAPPPRRSGPCLEADSPVAQMPEPEHPVHDGCIGYHLRTGEHDMNEYDWDCFMNFADRHLR